MRVALFTESYFPVVNGVSTSVVTQAKELIRAGHDCVIVAPHFPGYRDENPPCSVFRLPSWRTPLNPRNPFAYPPIGPIPRALIDPGFDIVHTHHPFGIGLQGRRLARTLDVPLVSTFHTLYMEYAHYIPFLPRPVVVGAITRHLRRYYSGCAAVIVPSQESGRRLQAIGVARDRLHVIPTGVPDAVPVAADARAAARKHFDLPEGRPIVLFVGRLAREKNLGLLMEAFAGLQMRHGAAAFAAPLLVLAGDGPFAPDCRQLAVRLGLEENIRFTGFLPRESIAPLYAMAAVFAFPSSSETQGVVLCEALSHGLPCVAVEGGGAAEFVRHEVDSLVVPPAVNAFRDALQRMLSDRELRDRFSAAALTTSLRFTPEQMVKKMIVLYESKRK